MAAVDVVQLVTLGPGTVLSSGGRRMDIINNVDPGGEGVTTIYFRMRARDANSVGLQYRYWLVEDAPDDDASEYTGPYDGGEMNFTDIAVIETYDFQPVVG